MTVVHVFMLRCLRCALCVVRCAQGLGLSGRPLHDVRNNMLANGWLHDSPLVHQSSPRRIPTTCPKLEVIRGAVRDVLRLLAYDWLHVLGLGGL